MIERFFHNWERRLASVTKDRVVRPFEWGADWISPNGYGEPDAAGRVQRWVDDVMRDTCAFFDTPETRDYAFDGATLRFPSALVTPHEANNTAVARWFPGDGGRASSTACRHTCTVRTMFELTM